MLQQRRPLSALDDSAREVMTTHFGLYDIAGSHLDHCGLWEWVLRVSGCLLDWPNKRATGKSWSRHNEVLRRIVGCSKLHFP